MAHPYHHALSSVKQWGGTVTDYQPIHDWFDESKKIIADFRHRALRHHAEGIFMAETIFGKTITLSPGRVIPTRWIGEQHVREDLGFIPSFADWVKAIRPLPWMGRAQRLEASLGDIPQTIPQKTGATIPSQKLSPINAAKALTPDWMQRIQEFDGLEIAPCRIIGHDSLGNEIVEPCDDTPEEAAFWTVYGHYKTGGVDAFEDFQTEAEAQAFHDRLLGVYQHLARTA